MIAVRMTQNTTCSGEVKRDGTLAQIRYQQICVKEIIFLIYDSCPSNNRGHSMSNQHTFYANFPSTSETLIKFGTMLIFI